MVTVLAPSRRHLADVSAKAGPREHLLVRIPRPPARESQGEESRKGGGSADCSRREVSLPDSSSWSPHRRPGQRIGAQVLLHRVPSGEGRPDAQGDVTSQYRINSFSEEKTIGNTTVLKGRRAAKHPDF